MSQEKFEKTLSLLKGALDYESFRDVDMVIETVAAAPVVSPNITGAAGGWPGSNAISISQQAELAKKALHENVCRLKGIILHSNESFFGIPPRSLSLFSKISILEAKEVDYYLCNSLKGRHVLVQVLLFLFLFWTLEKSGILRLNNLKFHEGSYISRERATPIFCHLPATGDP
nr:transcriptional repressor ILP1 [Ipomoea batatas]